MTRRTLVFATVLIFVLPAARSIGRTAGKVEGTFVVAGTDAQLKYVRAVRTKLDEKGKMGYGILLSAKNATGDIAPWRTAQPSERGSFIFLILEPTGAVWVAELGHVSAKSGRFGVVTEVTTSAFHVQGDQLSMTVRTNGEQEFTSDRYNINLKVDATIEQ